MLSGTEVSVPLFFYIKGDANEKVSAIILVISAQWLPGRLFGRTNRQSDAK